MKQILSYMVFIPTELSCEFFFQRQFGSASGEMQSALFTQSVEGMTPSEHQWINSDN